MNKKTLKDLLFTQDLNKYCHFHYNNSKGYMYFENTKKEKEMYKYSSTTNDLLMMSAMIKSHEKVLNNISYFEKLYFRLLALLSISLGTIEPNELFKTSNHMKLTNYIIDKISVKITKQINKNEDKGEILIKQLQNDLQKENVIYNRQIDT